ncbi:MAG: hypothetical protein ABSG04_09845 [Verrucomicrobiota bacterium]|jgi:hypothetical protein
MKTLWRSLISFTILNSLFLIGPSAAAQMDNPAFLAALPTNTAAGGAGTTFYLDLGGGVGPG